MPFGHRQNAAHTGFANGGRRAQGISVEGIKLRLQAHFSGGLDEQSQVVAPVACQHSLRAVGLDFCGVGQEIFHPANRMKLVANDLNVGPLCRHHRARLLQHLLTKAVVLADKVELFQRSVGLQHIGERSQAHVCVGVKTEMPETAFLVCERRLHRRVVQKQAAVAGLALVVFVQRVDQHRRRGRTVALQDETDPRVLRAAQHGQRFFAVALAVKAQQFQRPRAAGQLHAAACIDAINCHGNVAKHRFTGVGKWARQAFDHGQLDGLGRGPAWLAHEVSQRNHTDLQPFAFPQFQAP